MNNTGNYTYNRATNQKAVRNIAVATINAGLDQRLFDFMVDDEGLPSHPLKGPLLYSFSPSPSMIAVAAIQRTDEGLMLARVKVYESSDLAWIEEYPECDAHRPIACVQFWFDQVAGRWANGQKEAGHQLSFRKEYLDELADLVVCPDGYPDLLISQDSPETVMGPRGTAH
ncbi:MAG: hypothetical protein ACAH27_17015 [Xanthobacteraceae bacterium]